VNFYKVIDVVDILPVGKKTCAGGASQSTSTGEKPAALPQDIIGGMRVSTSCCGRSSPCACNTLEAAA
jgi:hypothetical protein